VPPVKIAVIVPATGEAPAREQFVEVEIVGVDIGRDALVERDRLIEMLEVDGQNEETGEHREIALRRLMSLSRTCPPSVPDR
jgi:hypothetical protein